MIPDAFRSGGGPASSDCGSGPEIAPFRRLADTAATPARRGPVNGPGQPR